jgi:hypothetical protein
MQLAYKRVVVKNSAYELCSRLKTDINGYIRLTYD